MKQEFNWRDYDNYNEWLHDALETLTESIEEKDKEIERLQDLCNKYEKEHKTTYEIWKKDIYLYNSMVDRIDKAIEYIEQLTNDEESIELMDINSLVQEELLNILKGIDKEC